MNQAVTPIVEDDRAEDDHLWRRGVQGQRQLRAVREGDNARDLVARTLLRLRCRRRRLTEKVRPR